MYQNTIGWTVRRKFKWKEFWASIGVEPWDNGQRLIIPSEKMVIGPIHLKRQGFNLDPQWRISIGEGLEWDIYQTITPNPHIYRTRIYEIPTEVVEHFRKRFEADELIRTGSENRKQTESKLKEYFPNIRIMRFI